ncbi:putative protein kinase TKL-CTR1-DRK-2 family [Helianthus annuus]|nr:putative protein kinase TKL-CTR1-DRK-2 family [Helianthus annuus]
MGSTNWQLTSPRSVAARVNPHLLLFRSGFNNVATVLETVSDMFFVDLVAEQQVSSLCLEAHEFMIAGRWLDLALLMITSADLVFPKRQIKLLFVKGTNVDYCIAERVTLVSVMKRLRHPNIVLFMGAVISPHHVCIVTEFLCR